MSKIVFYVARVCVFALLAVAALYAQSTGTITGVITDPTGAAVPGAQITCKNLETGKQYDVRTNTSGLFQIPDLAVGSYDVSISHPGFKTLRQTQITLLTEQTVDLTTTMQLGEAAQSVQVEASAQLVQTTTSELKTSVNSRQMADLPLNGRNAFDLAVLSPGATTTDASTTPGQMDNVGLSVNGFLATQNSWQLDGGTYNNLHFGSAPTLPNPDTLQEFTIMTSNFSADSRGGGAVVKLTTRSGTNQFHGTAFEFLRNTLLDTRNFFSGDPDPYKQNQYGGTLGGPVKKDKLFFFGSYQGTNKRGSPSPELDTVPTAAQSAGNFSATGKNIVDPLTGGVFPNDTIPQSRIDPIALKVLQYYPLPDYATNGYLEDAPANRDDYQWMLKGDYYLGTRDIISARYFWDRNTLDHDEGTVPGFKALNAFNNRTFLVSDTHTFSPTWVLHTAFNYIQTYRKETPVSPITPQSLGVQEKPAQTGIPDKINFTISGYTKLFSGRGLEFDPHVTEFQTDVSHTAGKHVLRFGTGIRHDVEYALNLADELGSYTFSAARTTSSAVKNSGDTIASMLLGLPATFVQSTAAAENFVETTLDPWIQDDWRVHRRLTVNLGMRWEPWLPPTDTDGYLTGFVPGVQSTLAPHVPKGLVFSGDPGIPASILRQHWATFSPRAGFAWDIFGNSKTVLRGGYGFFRAGAEFFGMQRTFDSSTPGRGVSLSIPNPLSTANPYGSYSGAVPFPISGNTAQSLSTLTIPSNFTLNALDPTAKPQYAQSWNLTVERQLGRSSVLSVSYVGNHFIDGMMTNNADPAIYRPGATVANEPTRVLYPGFGSVVLGTSADHGFYHSMQWQFTRRVSRGLTVMSNFSWSKALDISTAGAQGVSANVGVRDPLNLNLDKGPADFDTRLQFKLATVYEIPQFHGGNALVRGLANGWELNTIWVARSGIPFTCRSGVDNSLTGVSLDHCDQVMPNVGRPSGVSKVQEYFNTAAFTTNALGTFGTSGRNNLRRPGALTVNASVFRVFPIRERLKLELRVEAFNVFNHPNLDLFTTVGGYVNYEVVSSPTFGQITSAADPRLFQFALKLRF